MRLDWDGEDKTWVVTSFRDDQGQVVPRESDMGIPITTEANEQTLSEMLDSSGGAVENARHLRTSNEPDASVSSRIPDTTGQPKDTPAAPSSQEADEVSRAMEAARVTRDPVEAQQRSEAQQAAIAHGRELDDALFRMPDLPGWDDVRFREAVDAHASAELRSQAEASGPFGPILTQFQGRPDDAIEELKRLQTGDAIGALQPPHIGPIDLVWGDAGSGRSGHGLAKIIRKHPEVMDDLQGRLSSSTTILSESENRYRLTNGLDIFVVAKEFKGTPKRWLLTAYEQVFDEAGSAQRSIGRRMGRAGGLPEGSSPSAPLPSKDSPSASVLQEDRVLPEEIEMRRAAEERPGMLVDMGDGRGERPLSSVLDELDADADFAAVIALCGRPL